MLTGKALGEAIREAIRRKGVSQVEVADHFGVKPPSVQDWLNRGVIAKEKLPELWSYFSDVCTPAYWGLFLRDPSRAEETNTAPGPSIRGKAPIISWIQAGEPHEAIAASDIEGWVETTVPVRADSTFALRVKGDSMEPDFPEGVIIVVEKELEPHPGDYVIVRSGATERTEATFKQLVRDGDDLYLKPLNDRYPIKPLGTAQIVGVVREMVKKFR
ncbi:MAG: XRE family transcriptional regulator [Proteobacteria bacterium]|nr:XRE family transcriptional regulator [Pseudomonadota bacterium]